MSYDAVRALERTTAALREALRLWPPAPNPPRTCARDGWAVAGLEVPRGTTVELNIFAAHRCCPVLVAS